MTEKSEFREMRSFDLAIRIAYFKAQKRRNYAKNVVINRSAFGYLTRFDITSMFSLKGLEA